uniref:Uncharacterized protein n=1 Tax=Panagrolaimus davidi TaxID=227884 RepID=A0A914QIH0_9BILA
MNTLFPKLDFSQTIWIRISADFKMNRDILEEILQPSLERISLYGFPDENANPALLVFQRCPKIKEIQIMFGAAVPILTKNILKEMIKTKRKTKIEELIIDPVSEVDQNDFIKLIDNQLAPKCYVCLSPQNAETFYPMEEMFSNVNEILQNESKRVYIDIRLRSHSLDYNL